MQTSQFVALLLLVCFMSATMAAQSRRGDTLFTKYPLEAGISALFAEHDAVEDAKKHLTEATLNAMERAEVKKIDELTRATEMTVRSRKRTRNLNGMDIITISQKTLFSMIMIVKLL